MVTPRNSLLVLVVSGVTGCGAGPTPTLRFAPTLDCHALDSDATGACASTSGSEGSTAATESTGAPVTGGGFDLGASGTSADLGIATTGTGDGTSGTTADDVSSGGGTTIFFTTTGSDADAGSGGSDGTAAASGSESTTTGTSTGGEDTSGTTDAGGDTTSPAGSGEGPGGTTGDTTPGGTTSGGGSGPGDGTGFEGGDEGGGGVANACSNKCGFAKGGGLTAGSPANAGLDSVKECAKASTFPSTTGTIVACLTNLACHLGRDPSKLEALQALGVGTPKSMLGSNVVCGRSSASGQPIPGATSDQPEGVRALRCISSPFLPRAPWCSFTTLADDPTIECMNINTSVPNRTCGTEPVGIDVHELCAKVEASAAAPAGPAVFADLHATAVGGGPESCSQCHGALAGQTANGGKQCFFFPLAGALAVCPTEPLAAKCETAGAVATCSNGAKPRCPGQTTAEGQAATCQDGNAPTCSVGADAPTCAVEQGPFGTTQFGQVTFAGPEMCGELRQIVKNAKAAAAAGPPPPWTDTTFVDGYLQAFCPAP